MNWYDIYAYYNFNYISEEHPLPVTPSCDGPEDVRVYYTAWVNHAQTLKVLGNCSIIIKGDEISIDEGIEQLEEKCKADAFYVGANAVMNYSCELHLWDKPRTYRASGSRCVLRYNT